ncbi:sel1 repeat family protein [Endozoicomonas arenosclerae]|uniref:sel1 repeat family protein n=1 Tax=Endozoicomonas arenosclerae TaxID=1633495 RepID=UPI0012948091|nr:sel1 repeat family protein [Endozoicomonas arenosclerae]
MKAAGLALLLVLFPWQLSAEETAQAGRCSSGLTIYLEGEYAKAFEVLKVEADRGLDCAQHWVARMYQLGHGTPMNKELSKTYYKLAANQGFEQSIMQLELLKSH